MLLAASPVFKGSVPLSVKFLFNCMALKMAQVHTILPTNCLGGKADRGILMTSHTESHLIKSVGLKITLVCYDDMATGYLTFFNWTQYKTGICFLKIIIII